MNDSSVQDDIDSLIRCFFAAFDNRNGRTPIFDKVIDLFADKAVIAKHWSGQCEIYSLEEFAMPRVVLLGSGDLTEFHEWEETSSTQIAGGIASRVSRYAKSGLYFGKAYVGTGTKFIQLVRFVYGWRIVALSWIDDDA